ncbi:MAG: sensor domain-containing diguanylate cyclase [Gammaproteobacteria bacterium]|nr:MAG: sensor domain-containing diguanylate cyclase [Gammaproteobacteria bacterium]
MLQTVDVGLLVLDREYKVQLWNSFMENHSGIPAYKAKEQSLFDLFPEVQEDWFRHKTRSVFLLKNRTFTTWEQRPFLFRFRNYRPITGTEDFMYQNITISPLLSAAGDVDFICVLVYDVTDIASHRKQLMNANARLAQLSRTDRLTGLFNRGYWEEMLAREFLRFKRSQSPSTLVMFDIDHFKKVNDTYGHQAGDEVIRQVSAALTETTRATDICGRYGGEEFGVILPDTTGEKGLIFAERLRQRVEGLVVEHGGQTICFTISLGLAEASPDFPGHADWIEAADQALYHSKENGRNRSTLQRPPSPAG